MKSLRLWYAKSLVAPIVVTWIMWFLWMRLLLYVIKEL